MTTDFEIINRVCIVVQEILDEIVTPTLNLKSDLKVSYFESSLQNIMGGDSRAESIYRQINKRYKVPLDLLRKNSGYPLALLGLMCIDYKSIGEMKYGQ